MQYYVFIKYLLKNFSFFFLYSLNFFSNSIVLFIPSFLINFIALFLKYSFFFKNFFLLDLGCYETPVFFKESLAQFKYFLWYIFKNNFDESLFIFTLINKFTIGSVEKLFRNAKWLERETFDFFNVFFKNKKDRRSLFTIPIFYESPLKKKFPTVGFYELFICFFLKKIKFKHISFKN